MAFNYFKKWPEFECINDWWHVALMWCLSMIMISEMTFRYKKWRHLSLIIVCTMFISVIHHSLMLRLYLIILLNQQIRHFAEKLAKMVSRNGLRWYWAENPLLLLTSKIGQDCRIKHAVNTIAFWEYMTWSAFASSRTINGEECEIRIIFDFRRDLSECEFGIRDKLFLSSFMHIRMFKSVVEILTSTAVSPY